MQILRPLFALTLAACAVDVDLESAELDLQFPPVVYTPQSPRWNHVFGKATHNSYHMNRGAGGDAYASGASEQLVDQLLIERTSALEFDVRANIYQAGDFTVAHTDRPDYSQCNTLVDCLQMLRSFHYANPDHDPILVTIELKGNPLVIRTNTFDSTHTIEDLDWNFRSVFGDSLYQPADFMADCPQATTLSQCLASRGGWPTLEEMRGKFVVGVAGYWDNNYNDWITYGARDDMRLRAAFPVRNVFYSDGGGIALGNPAGVGTNMGPVNTAMETRARQNSIILQVEPGSATEWYEDLARNPLRDLQLVRGSTFDGLGDPIAAQRQNAGEYGMTWFATDFPWNTWSESLGAIDMRRRYHDPSAHFTLRAGPAATQPAIDPRAMHERGQRILFSANSVLPFAYTTVPASSYRFWDTTVSVTRWGATYGINRAPALRTGGKGCLRAAASRRDWIQICRYKDGNGGDAEVQERTVVFTWMVRDGVTSYNYHYADIRHRDSIGAHLAMEVENRGPGSIVRLYSAGRISASGTPEWRLLETQSFSFALDKQGFAASEDVLFAGARYRDEANVVRDVTMCDLAQVDATVMPRIVNASIPASNDTVACPPALAPLPATSPGSLGGSWRQILADVGSEPAVVNRLDGTRFIFYRAYDGSIRYTSAGDGFAGGNLGGWLAPRAPVVARYNDGRFHVFAIGNDGAVWQTSELSVGGLWSGWTSLGGWVTDIAAGINQDGRLELFVVGGGGVLYQKWQGSVGGNWYGGWHQMSGAMGGPPAVTRHRDGRQIVFARATDGAIWAKSQAQVNGGWGNWSSLGGGLTGKPTAMLDPWGYVVMFARGGDGNIWSQTQTTPNATTFSAWRQLSSGGSATNPIVATQSDGGWDVFYRGSDQRVQHMTQGRGWWATLAGFQPGWAAEPAVTRKRDGRMSVIAADYHGTLWESDVP